MLDWITFELLIGHTHGHEPVYFSIRNTEDIFKRSRLPWVLLPGIGGEGADQPTEDAALGRVIWKPESGISLDECCRRMEAVIRSLLDRLAQRWIQLECDIVEEGISTKRLFECHSGARWEITAADLVGCESSRGGRPARSSGRALFNGSADADEQTLEFHGADSLSLANLAWLLSREPMGRMARVCVVGMDNAEKKVATFDGYFYGATIDDYVRSVILRTKENVMITVGGDNATAERVAAADVRVRLSRGLYDDLKINNPSIVCHAVECPTPSMQYLRDLVATEQISAAIAFAKRLADVVGLTVLWNYLRDGRRYPDGVADALCDAFRSFDSIYARSEEWAEHVVLALAEYIERELRSATARASVLYAIESMGYAARHHANTRMIASEFLLRILEDPSLGRRHSQLPWVTVTALEHIMPTDPRHADTLSAMAKDLTGLVGEEHILSSIRSISDTLHRT